MSFELQPALIQRLERLAEKNQCTVDDLLSYVADNLERTQFPGNPYKLLNQSPALITVSDSDGNYLYVNDAFCNATGYDRETMLKKQFSSLIHPDDLEKTVSVRQAIIDGNTLDNFENRYLHHDGAYRWFAWTAIPDGDYIYAIALDVTDQKRVEAELRQTLKNNERILRTTFDGYVLGNRDGQIIDVNQRFCEMLGYSQSDLLRMQVYDLDAALPNEQINANTQLVIDDEQPLLIETQHRHKDGHLLDVEISSVPIHDDQIACFIRDITARKELERQLRRSEQYHRGLIESQTNFVCRYTPDTVLTYVNDAYCRHFGKSRDELIGTSFLTLASDFDEDPIFARIDQIRANPSPDVRRFKTYDVTGENRWIEWTDFGIQNQAGELLEIQAVGHDITHVMETKERLREREEMLSTIFKNIPVMLAQFDEVGHFQYVNKYWVDVLGWTLSEMQSHPNIMKAFYPDPEYRQNALDYMLAGTSEWQEFDTHTKDGRILRTAWANVHLSDGRAIGIGVDLSERMKIEEKLRASEEKFRTMLELAVEGILLVDQDGIIRLVNRQVEQQFQISRDELIGQSVDMLIPQSLHSQHEIHRSNYMQNPTERPMGVDRELQAVRHNGTTFPVEISLTPIEIDSALHIMAFVVDISERKQLEKNRLYSQQLELELEKERELIEIRERFVSLVSHEFRTPLAVMQSSTSLVRRYIDQLPQERIIEKLDTVSQQITRMVDLMEDALRFSKTRAGKADFYPEDFDLTLFFERIIHTMMIVDENQHPVILEGDTGTIHADVKLLDHIFSNLVSNALKYSPEDRTVTIAITEHPNEWVFEITDEGIGIPEEDLPQLFEPFYRATNARNKTGTGLGLSIVKEYVELHGGHISVESTLGQGSVFTIHLPVTMTKNSESGR